MGNLTYGLALKGPLKKKKKERKKRERERKKKRNSLREITDEQTTIRASDDVSCGVAADKQQDNNFEINSRDIYLLHL